MQELLPYIWIAVFVLSLVIEGFTADLVSIWFSPAALVAMITAYFHAPILLQLVLFFGIGGVLLLCIRPFCRRFLHPDRNRTNVQSLIGKSCLVTQEIRNREEVGEVHINGLRWSARAECEDEIIPVGQEVIVTDIRGVKLIVHPK